MLGALQKKKLTRYFRVYDIDNDGRVGPRDFERVVENLRTLHGLDVDSPGHLELKEGFMRSWDDLRWWADRDGDGGVDVDEWLDYWEELLSREQRYEDEVAGLLSRVFSLFDRDGDGRLGIEEFQAFYGVYGLDPSLARSIFAELDVNHDGAISREELEQLGHEFYKGNDPEAPGNRLFGPY